MTWGAERNDIFDFIDNELPGKLIEDQKELRIVSEADLQSCTYHHLREFFEESQFTRWYIQNQLSMGERKSAKKIPDIVISWMERKKPKSNSPGILIELKEHKNFHPDVAEDEIQKLAEMMDTYECYGFFLYACRDIKSDKKVKQTDKIMKEIILKYKKKNLGARTINIRGTKTYGADMEYFDEKIEILSKYRR